MKYVPLVRFPESPLAATLAAPLFVLAAVSQPALGATISLAPSYLQTYTDAVTGWNCPGMTVAGGCNAKPDGWFVSAGADVYSNDVYERPTSQTYTSQNGKIVASEYLGYLDLVDAQYGFNSQYMFFQLTMFSPYLYKNDGTVDTGVFGSGTYYGVQLGSADSNNGQLLLRAEQTKDTVSTSTSSFDSQKTQGWYDTNNSVAGPGGVGTPNEEGLITNFNGYESDVIETDGKLKGTSSFILFSRSFINPDGTVSVELAFDYLAYNNHCTPTPGSSTNCLDIDPGNLPYLVFETTRGLKDNQNYLWNDKYNSSEAGTPYTTAGLGNIYELDNMRQSYRTPDPDPDPDPEPLPPPNGVPEPATLGLAGLALVLVAALRRNSRRHGI